MFCTDGAAEAMRADFAKQQRDHKKSLTQERRHDAHVHAYVEHISRRPLPASEQHIPAPPRSETK